mgnify:CR=1 FL=1
MEDTHTHTSTKLSQLIGSYLQIEIESDAHLEKCEKIICRMAYFYHCTHLCAIDIYHDYFVDMAGPSYPVRLRIYPDLVGWRHWEKHLRYLVFCKKEV